MPHADALLCHCRAGFEPELAAELTERASEAGFAGYARTERGIEVKTWRPTGRDDNDSWLLRARRVAVPYVTAPKAGIRITGTGL